MINSLKDLESLIKLCRKHGVTKIDCMGISFDLGEKPVKERRGQLATPGVPLEDPYKDVPNRILTEDELIYWSTGGPATHQEAS